VIYDFLTVHMDTIVEVAYRSVLAFAVANVIMAYGGFLTWIERKQSALMQNRIGANRAPIFGIRALGLPHMITDGIKMLTKEDWIPPGADKVLHTLAPLLSISLAILVFVAVPVGDRIALGGQVFDLRVADINLGILMVFALLGLIVYGVVLAGLSSNNNFSMLGGLRASAQMVSYEIVLGISVIGIILVFGTLDLQEIIRAQGKLLFGFLPMWGVVLQPIGFLLFITAIIAESKRVPFDLPEGESEIIGYFTEYSGMKFGLFLFADFVESLIGGCLVTILFFGGWQIPWVTPPTDEALTLGWTLLSVGAFAAKVLFFTWLFMTIRWTLPRFRYDQLMDLCWKMMLPVALVNAAVTAVLVVLLDGGA
jgi:NADH-quinone oxidoreductase subunit H